VAALAVPMADGAGPTVAIIGHDGLVGLPALLGEMRSPQYLSWCVSGSAVRIRSEDLLAAALPFGQLVRMLSAYAEIRLTGVAQNAACSGLHDVRARCARLLLALSDAADTDRLDFSHESLAMMLGVSRQSVSLALASLRVDRKISYAAGRIVIIDRGGLEGASCECYAIVRSESERVLRSLVT
jgi:CRP-like cAMP-binding protein